jgi:hypothetical protein
MKAKRVLKAQLAYQGFLVKVAYQEDQGSQAEKVNKVKLVGMVSRLPGRKPERGEEGTPGQNGYPGKLGYLEQREHLVILDSWQQRPDWRPRFRII